MKFLCRILGHRWTWLGKYDRDGIRLCSRCKAPFPKKTTGYEGNSFIAEDGTRYCFRKRDN